MNYYGSPGLYQQTAQYNDMDCIIEPSVGVGGLYLGNYSAATNLEGLMMNGIRCIVTTANESNFSHPKDSVPYHIKFPAQDVENFALEQYFDQAADYIDQHLQLTNVLVHCMAGVSRSVSITIAYLMKYRGMRLEDSLRLVRSRRSVVSTQSIQANPNNGFLHQLKKYEKVVQGYGGMYARGNRGLQVPHSPSPRNRSPSPTAPVYYNPEDRNGGLKGSRAQIGSPTTGMYLTPPIQPGYMQVPNYDPYANGLRGSLAGQNQDLTSSWSPAFMGYGRPY